MAIHKTKENKDKFLVALESKAGNIAQSYKAIGISRQAFYNWCSDDLEFHRHYLEVRESMIDFAEATLLTLIKEKHATATIFFLKTQGKHRGYQE